MLSSECHRRFELSRGNLGFARHFEACVRRRATLSVNENPTCSARAKEFVELAWAGKHIARARVVLFVDVTRSRCIVHRLLQR